jgi:hypothetical protein
MTYVPYLLIPSPHIFPASIHILCSEQPVLLPGTGPSIVGEAVMIGMADVLMEHEGMLKVGVAVGPESHSTQVLCTS